MEIQSLVGGIYNVKWRSLTCTTYLRNTWTLKDRFQTFIPTIMSKSHNIKYKYINTGGHLKVNKGNAKRSVSPRLNIWPGDLDLWPWKSIGFQILLRTMSVPSLVKIHWRMLILECSQGCYAVKIWPSDIDLWPWKSIRFQTLLRTKYVISLVKIHWRMLILECSQGCYVVQIWPGDLDLWPWKSIEFQTLLRTKSRYSIRLYWTGWIEIWSGYMIKGGVRGLPPPLGKMFFTYRYIQNGTFWGILR
jgi:hypothetical protein